jgi:hypothetical protein
VISKVFVFVRDERIGKYGILHNEAVCGFYRSRTVVKVRPITCCEGTEEEMRYRFTLSLTSVPDGAEWSTPRSDRFTSGQDPIAIV